MAGLNIPKRKKMTAESLYEKATSAGDKLGRAASLGSQMLFGEVTGRGGEACTTEEKVNR